MSPRLLVLLLLVALLGCRREVAKAPPVIPEDPAVEEKQPTAEEPEQPQEEVPATPEEGSPEESADEPPKSTSEEADPEKGADEPAEEESTDSDDDAVADQEASEAEVAEEPKLPRERFLLLTRDGPLVIDVVMTIDGAPYPEAFESVLDMAMAEADPDEDGDATWEEMLDNPKFAYGQFGNLIPEDEGERARLIQMYDNNRDSLVDRDELPRFLTRNAGGARAFSLQSSNEFRGDNRTHSPVRRLLDQDRDGAITPGEIAAAPVRLFNRDSDDDEILVLADFRETVAQMPTQQISNRRRLNAPDTAIRIGERTRWNNVTYALQETYAYGNRVTADDIPLTASLLAQLDDNENEMLDAKEVLKIADVPPHLEFNVAFFNQATEGEEDTTPKIALTFVCDELQSIVDAALRHPTRLSMLVPGAEVAFFVNDDPSLVRTNQIVTNQFNTLDADNNNYVDEEEYSGQFLGFDLSFEAADTDGDGKVYEKDLLAFVEIRQSVMRAQIRARAADQEDALFTALDTTGDGRLTAREIHGAPEVLKSLDHNNDDRVQSHEIAGSIAVGFVRGNPQNNNSLFVMPAPPRKDSELPSWFRGMDTNGDGDISPREFLGASSKFQELDQDADGFISGDEIKVEASTVDAAASD